jgi:hypothetical protein
MGTVMGLVAVSDGTIRRLLADPPLVWKLLAPDDPEPYQEARADSTVPGDDDEDLELGEGEGDHLHLDKSWHGIHYLLTGTAWEGNPPLDLLVSGGEPIGDIEVGQGPARALTATQVAEASRALAALSDESIRSRFDPPAMLAAKIYPEIWARPPAEDDTLGYLVDYLGQLRRYLARQASAGMGVVISLS